ncbi:hypothetical protein P4H39_31190 [Paenibacillus lautus]|nr:hypothetical protein [Paenibacillus lautus]MEC0207077.1 hypothetical protein [Paenibacillus lautus]
MDEVSRADYYGRPTVGYAVYSTDPGAYLFHAAIDATKLEVKEL